jgi:hypothetical protein
MRRLTPLTLAVAFTVTVLSPVSFNHAATRPRVALNAVLPDLNFAGVTFGDAMDFLRDVSGSNLHVNWAAVEAVGVGRDTIINLRLRNIPLRKVLQLVLSEAGAGDLLAYYVDDDVIEVTTRELADHDLITRIYPVDDLIMAVPDFVGPDLSLQGSSVGGSSSGSIVTNTGSAENNKDNMTRQERAEELIKVITDVIKPDIWQVNGGTAAIRFFNGSLIVTAPRSVHEALGGPVD